MKIFNWVHRRFHHTSLKDGLTSNLEKTEAAMTESETQALLKQVALVDMLGGWRDGILTIGTFGFDPSNSTTLNQQKEYMVLGREKEQDPQEELGEESLVDDHADEASYNVEQEELNPLMLNTYEHDFDNFKSGPEIPINASKPAALTPFVGSQDEIEPTNGEIDEKKKKGERITLADLFLAESSDVKLKIDPAKVLLHPCEQPFLRTKHGLSFVKKLIPHVKEDANPIKNLKGLMKRMMKRKIHPEVDVKSDKPYDHPKQNAIGHFGNDKEETSESVSLLPPQGDRFWVD